MNAYEKMKAEIGEALYKRACEIKQEEADRVVASENGGGNALYQKMFAQKDNAESCAFALVYGLQKIVLDDWYSRSTAEELNGVVKLLGRTGKLELVRGLSLSAQDIILGWRSRHQDDGREFDAHSPDEEVEPA